MKRASIALTLLVACSVSQQPTSQSQARNDIVIDGVSIKYNGNVLAIAGDVHAWLAVFGQPSRVDSRHHLYTWDDLGLYVRTKFKVTEYVDEFGVVFDKDAPSRYYTYWPRNSFLGRLILDGGVVTKNTVIGHVKKRPPKFREGPSPITYFYWRDDTKPRLYVAARVHDDGTPFCVTIENATN
jgi:hypothetical protein